MNIVVLGGNCNFSSELSKALNKKLTNSVVVRINTLNPLRRILFPTFPQPNKRTPIQSTFSNAGEYLGDVETLTTSTFEQLASPKIKEITKKLIVTTSSLTETFLTTLKASSLDNSVETRATVDRVDSCLNDILRRNNLITDYYSLSPEHKLKTFFKTVHVFSGISTVKDLKSFKDTQESYLSCSGPTAFIFLSNSKHTWLDNEITKEDIINTYKDKMSLLGPVFNVSNVDELLEKEEFLTFVNYVSQAVEEKKEEEKPAKVLYAAITMQDLTEAVQTLAAA